MPKASKHKKKSKTNSRDRSLERSSNNSLDMNTSVRLLKTLEDKRIQEHIEQKRLKERLKANETLEEKRARRLLEKQAKEQRKRQRMGWDTEYQSYTNQDNPFGDSNLTSTFVWNKKLEKDGLKDVSLETVEVLSKQKQYENKRELEKVKKRRLERELEKQLREEELLNQQRSREIAQFQEWERQEDLFHFEQAKLRSSLRIQDGRAKPIDLLAQYITSTNLEEGIEMQMHEPYVLLKGLSIKDLEDLLVDIKVYLELEKGNNIEFWNDMTVIVEDELQKLNKIKDDELKNSMLGRREGIHQSVVKDVADIFKGKNSKQLDELRSRIEMKISNRSDGVDISYWESLLLQLNAHLARARLRDHHQQILRQKLDLLKKESEESKCSESKNTNDNDDLETNNDNPENDQDRSSEAMLAECFQSYIDGNYSPKYIPEDSIETDSLVILSEDEDLEANKKLRMEFFENHDVKYRLNHDEMIMRNEARKGMLGDEAEFSVESPLDSPTVLSSDKYRPRKPRYFNRVHTGFEWNKYNQTHYDMDNPPPKIVQGYKFNIFYPDLIDKSTTPQYNLTPCEDNTDFAILRFYAGPPYEDIAFKIVNREWEFSYKRGFRCQFHNNIFQLWFHFKRYRYRR